MKNDQRYKDSLASKKTLKRNADTLFLLSPSDIGVRRNRGRNGARFAPKVILNQFLKLNDHLDSVKEIRCIPTTSKEIEEINFEESQKTQSQKILNELNEDPKNIIHIGGGHDHVFPFLKAVQSSKKYKNIFIVNIDAHCDTRVDTSSHSGTPFRDFDKSIADERDLKVTLYQYGIQEQANSKSTLQSLKYIEQRITTVQEELKLNFDSFNEDSFILLSLDADGLDSSIMKAVSAVNPYGVKQSSVVSIIQKIKLSKAQSAFGIYEYNPIYDDLSNQGARVISHLIYNWLK